MEFTSQTKNRYEDLSGDRRICRPFYRGGGGRRDVSDCRGCGPRQKAAAPQEGCCKRPLRFYQKEADVAGIEPFGGNRSQLAFDFGKQQLENAAHRLADFLGILIAAPGQPG